MSDVCCLYTSIVPLRRFFSKLKSSPTFHCEVDCQCKLLFASCVTVYAACWPAEPCPKLYVLVLSAPNVEYGATPWLPVIPHPPLSFRLFTKETFCMNF